MLVDALTNVSLTAQMNCLEVLGLNEKNINRILAWGQDRTGSLLIFIIFITLLLFLFLLFSYADSYYSI